MCFSCLCCLFFFFFFFSSRRRHTRLTCDWSSDVCSSDLRGTLVRQPWNGVVGDQIDVIHKTFDQIGEPIGVDLVDRKSTRLNSSHMSISYAVFCLKKKIRPRESGRKQRKQVGIELGSTPC